MVVGSVLLTVVVIVLIVMRPDHSEQTASASRPGDGTRFIVPEAGDGIKLSAAASEHTITLRDSEEELQPRVPLSGEYLLTQIEETNLNRDQNDEQIIAFKRRDDPEDRIRVLVAEFDSVRNTYRVAWEGETGANNVRTFALYTADLTGDHDLEIIAFGTNNAGEQTLDVFQSTDPPGGVSLYYRPILSVVTDANIEIDEQERSEAYYSMQSSGSSFPIYVYSRDEDSDDERGLVRVAYRFHPDDGQYVESQRDSIPGTEVEEAQLQELYDGDVAEFQRFLRGPWYRSSGSDSEVDELVFFDPVRSSIVFYRGDRQESFSWETSHKTLHRSGPGLRLNLENESISTVRRQLSATATGIDELLINVDGSDQWDGRYRRLTDSLQRRMLSEQRSAARLRDDLPTGLYRSDAGLEIFFSSPRFTMRDDGEEVSGGFAMFELDRPVLQLKQMNANGVVIGTRAYQFEQSKNRTADQIVRTLELYPARITAEGVEVLDTEAVTLEQIEQVDEEQDDSEQDAAS